jgi:hypothetical protein
MIASRYFRTFAFRRLRRNDKSGIGKTGSARDAEAPPVAVLDWDN